MNALLSAHPATEFTLTIASGRERGTIYRLMASRITIGRGSDCDIILKEDPKISRKHAIIEITDRGFEVRDLTERNKIQVDGRECSEAVLGPKSTIILGNTELRFEAKAQPLVSAASPHASSVPAPMGPPPGPMAMPTHPNPPGTPPRHRSRKPKKKKNKTFFNILLLAMFGLFGWLLLSDSGPKEEAVEIRTEEQIQADIEAAEQLRQAAEEQQAQRAGKGLTYKEAQANYVQGFRDYRKGQYGRAMEAFQACLSLFPDHTLCNRYLRLSQKKYNELIQYQMILGRKYREQNQYRACTTAFRNVMFMVKDMNNPTYKEAKANYESCDAFLKGRF